MLMQQFDDKMISITQVRRDIGILKSVLDDEGEAFVMKNQQVLFVALAPDRYKQFLGDESGEDLNKAVGVIEQIRNKYGTDINRKMSASDYVVGMREERKNKWKR